MLTEVWTYSAWDEFILKSGMYQSYEGFISRVHLGFEDSSFFFRTLRAVKQNSRDEIVFGEE